MSSSLPQVSEGAIAALLASRQLPPATAISQAHLTAQYHSIYMLTLQDQSEAVLRIAGNQIPRLKTDNEVAVMTWVRQNTTIPVPAVLAYDFSTNNPIKHEYTLLAKVRGVCADTIYATCTTEQQLHIVRQIADFVIQLHSKPLKHIGGLVLSGNGSVEPGPVVEVRSWQSDDIQRAWVDSQPQEPLNVTGPFDTWTAYSIAKLQRSLFALETHPNLAELNKRLAARTRALIVALEEEAAAINACPHVLAHKDMHFSNFMCDPQSLEITGVLDWEFSQAAPLPSWDPGNFLLFCPADDSDAGRARADQKRVLAMFGAECEKRGAGRLVSSKKTDLQEAMEDAVELLGWIVRSVPTGKYASVTPTWLEELDEAFDEFEV